MKNNGIKLGSVLVNINVMTTERFIDESENKEKFKDFPLL
jgi:hypothetical protein